MKLETGRVTDSQSLLKLSTCVNAFGLWMLIVARVADTKVLALQMHFGLFELCF